MTKKISTYCIGLSNLILNTNGIILGNLFFDIDNLDKNFYNHKFNHMLEFIWDLQTFCDKYKMDMIVIKSVDINNKNTNQYSYHLISPEIFNKSEIMKYQKILFKMFPNQDYLPFKYTISHTCKTIHNNKKINIGNVLRISKKMYKSLRVFTVIYSKNKSNRQISNTILEFYKQYGLSINAYCMLLQRHRIFNKENLVEIYKTSHRLK